MPVSGIVFAMTGACGLHGGIAVVNLNLLRALDALARRHGLPLTVLAYHEQSWDRPPFLPADVEYRAYGSNRYAMAAELLRRARTRPLFVFDHVNVARAVLPLAALGLVRTVIFAHGWENWRSVNRTDAWSLRLAERVLANSEFTLRKVRERFPTVRGRACALGLHPSFSLNHRVPDAPDEPIRLDNCDGQERVLGKRVLFLAARMDPTEREKGHFEVLRILPRLLVRHPDVQLVFSGTGADHETLMAEARNLGVGAQTFMPGQVDVPTLDLLFRQCYAFVMPSTQEGFGLVYLEAMNAGKPCLGCLDQGTEDVILQGETGLLIRDRCDPDELTGAILKLLDDPAWAQAMGRKGFARLHEIFTAEKFRARFQAAVEEVLL